VLWDVIGALMTDILASLISNQPELVPAGPLAATCVGVANHRDETTARECEKLGAKLLEIELKTPAFPDHEASCPGSTFLLADRTLGAGTTSAHQGNPQFPHGSRCASHPEPCGGYHSSLWCSSS
jgi:hypothetical protein